MSWNNFEHKCRECDGQGEIACDECGSPHECTECEGEGIDPDLVDLAAFRAAARLAFTGCNGAGALVENDVWVGEQSDDHKIKVYYRDFLKKEVSNV